MFYRTKAKQSILLSSSLALGLPLFSVLYHLPGFAATTTNTFDRFGDWCLTQKTRSQAQQHTIQILLEQAKTQDCQKAEQILSNTPQLNLGNRQIQDISPLSTLPNLTSLDLSFNQITDLKPLAKLTRLNFLLLAGNQIRDVKSLSSLTRLTYLVLEKNQIQEVSPLASLTQLRTLILLANPIATKHCPVRPATICIFSNDGEDLYAQAETQYQQGRFQLALNTFQTVLEGYTKAGDQLKQADTLNRLGDTTMNLGQYAQALSFYQTAFTLRQKLGDLPGAGVSLTSLASAYEQLGQYQKAQETLKQAIQNIKEQKQGGIPLEGGIYELPKDEAAVHNRLALVQNQLNQPQEALVSAQHALKLYQLLPDGYNGKRFGERTVLDTIGRTYGYLGQFDAAIATLKQADTIAKEIGDRAGEATTLNHLGEIHLTLKQYPAALKMFQQTLAIRREVGDKPGIGATLNNLGVTFLQQGDVTNATQTLLEAIQIWESLRPGLTDDNKVSLFETQVVTYSTLQQALIAQNKTDAALEMAERSRARAFIELLAARLGAKVSQQFESTSPPTVEQIRQIAKTRNATLVEYSIVGETLFIWVIQPNGIITLRSVKFTELGISLEDAAEKTRVAAATGQNRGMTPHPNGLNTFVRGTRETLEARTLATPNQSLEDIETKPLTTSSNDRPPRRKNHRLQQSYHLLIEPIADLLPTDPNAHVIFIPQGPLFLVPFPALQDAMGNYLLEKHTILTTPSIQVLQFTGQHKTRIVKQSEALVVGNPTMPSVSVALGEPPEPLSNLPAAEQEALAIAQILKTQALTRDEATESVVVSRMQKASIIHLATHGLLDDFNHLGFGIPGAIALAPASKKPPSSSKLNHPVTPSGKNHIEDGLLTANQILDLNLTADLVVLSACNTGRGIITGDGVVGLSRTFIAAGVPSILVSLWAVPDAPTSDLMVEFYRQLQLQPNKAQALRQATLKTMQKHPHPGDWAAFTLIGEP